ncbi:MAG: nitrite/sulfite reductase [Candidatus Nitrosocaldus sp.]|nr:nitrite/sulfite reductase [Candidatus Nitrosocaldus sp.]MDW8275870.1 nitrite/sulfite reductase [Candidatus Nitrosocaldus sp.]
MQKHQERSIKHTHESEGGGGREQWGLPEEVTSVEEMIRLYREGKVSDDEFRRFRLQHGMYGSRLNQNYTMIRIKVPAGILYPEQLIRLAKLSEDFSIGSVHVTTRQNIQMHWVYLDDAPAVEKGLVEVGLTTREACGNTIRNVTCSPFAGVCMNEPFDVTPYAKALARFFLRNPMCQNLPRKFKFNFACCDEHSYARIADVGLVPVLKHGADGRSIRGFRVYIGGGLGPASYLAELLEEFTPEDMLLSTCMAVVRLFDRLGDREKMHRNRMRYLVHDMGFERFRELVLKERRAVEMTRSVLAKLYIREIKVDAPEMGQDAMVVELRPFNMPDGFDRWVKSNVMDQRQKGYAVVFIPLPAGDVTARQLRALAGICREFSHEGHVITTPTQGFALRWVMKSRLVELYRRLSEAGLANHGALSIASVVGCTSTTSCNLAITNAHRLAKEIRSRLIELGLDMDESLKDATIKLSGCPNSCGQHMIATIGFFGAAVRINNSLTPAYNMLLGGKVGKDSALGRVVARVPAKRIIDVILRLIDVYREERLEGESLASWIDRVLDGKGTGKIKGIDDLKPIIEEASRLPPPAEDPESYVDYGSDSRFIVRTARGECAA